jgi:ribosome modulation factor
VGQGNDMGVGYKNIFRVMFCVDHCVYVLLGTPNLWLGGWDTVG